MQRDQVYKQAFAHQSWHRGSIRELMTALIDEHPQLDDEGLVRLAIERMRAEEEWLIAAGEYAVMQTLSTLHRRRVSTPIVSAAVVAAKREERETKIQQGVEQIMLLNMEMPNGKRLRYCTREDVAKWGKGYERMAKKMKPQQMVGQAFNEDQVKAIMK